MRRVLFALSFWAVFASCAVCQTSSSTGGLSIPMGDARYCKLDGTNNMAASLTLFVSASDPVSPTPVEGDIYYNSTSNLVMQYNGSGWVAVGDTSGYLPLAGGTMTGNLGLWDNNGAPTGGNGSLWYSSMGPYLATKLGNQNTHILTALEEGSGGGIDADTVDGSHGSAFLTAETDPIFDDYFYTTGYTRPTEYGGASPVIPFLLDNGGFSNNFTRITLNTRKPTYSDFTDDGVQLVLPAEYIADGTGGPASEFGYSGALVFRQSLWDSGSSSARDVQSAMYMEGNGLALYLAQDDPFIIYPPQVFSWNYDGTFIAPSVSTATYTSTATTGTAPLTVASTTAVTNLNADMVDGTHASAFLTAEVDGVVGNEVTNATDSTLTRSGSGTGVSPYTLGLNLGNANTWTALQQTSLDGNNAALEVAQCTNTNQATTGQTGDTASISFDLMGTSDGGGSYAAAEAARIEVYKVSDWFNASGTADNDSGLKFYTVSNGTAVNRLQISEDGSLTAQGGTTSFGRVVYSANSSVSSADTAGMGIDGIYYEGTEADAGELRIAFGGFTTSDYDYTVAFPNPAGTDKTATFPDAVGTVGLVGTSAPASAVDTGVVGEIRVTATYIYVCTAPNTWVRAALATW